ncbi:MAG: BLUF domain-containing protein [Gammaproteobacteria bacterium]|nr:BLUF domain-containing protein [Gammaproteobacteria bacterium]
MRNCRLVYRSTARPEVLAGEQLAKLQQECDANNARLHVKGLLVVSGGHFLQVLEGAPRFVNEIFAAIAQDQRHHEVELITYEGSAKPHFYDWSMRLVDVATLPASFQAMFLKKYPQRGEVLAIPDDPLLVHSLLLDVKYALG